MEHNPLVIIGTGPEARIALDIFTENDILVYGFVSETEEIRFSELNDVNVFGYFEDEDVRKVLKGTNVDYIVAIGDNDLRQKVYLDIIGWTKRPAINAVHRFAGISQYARVGFGNIFNGGVMINPNAEIGDHNIFHSQCAAEPNVVIGNYCTFGSGVRIGGNARIDDDVFIGTGAVIHPGVKIEKGAMIGAGSVVLKTVESGQKVFGNPAAVLSKK